MDVRTLCILFCFMAAVAGMRECNLFGTLAGRLLAGERSMRALCTILVALPFLSSMLVTNDVALIAFVPFTVLVLELAGRRDAMIPVIVMQTLGANLGSMLLPFGNPQNLFIHSKYGLDFMDPVTLLGPLVVIGGVLLFALCLGFGKGRVKVGMNKDRDVRNPGLLMLSTVLFLLSVAAVLRIVPYQVVLAATTVSFLLTRRSVLLKVDYELLLTFVFLFVFTGNIATSDAVGDFLGDVMSRDPMFASLGLSQVVSNVPAATLLSNFTDDWSGLMAGVDIGGFGTPIASMASMISLGIYAKTEGADLKRYLMVFLAGNAAMLAVLIPAYVLL